MNKRNTEKLYKDFPELYKQHSWSMQDTCMCWGFECDDGWFDLIYQLSKDIVEKSKNKIQAIQVKEKFGGLRFYYQWITEDNTSLKFHREIEKLIEEAENKSYKICEICGNPGEPNENGWISTLCEKCRKE